MIDSHPAIPFSILCLSQAGSINYSSQLVFRYWLLPSLPDCDRHKTRGGKNNRGPEVEYYSRQILIHGIPPSKIAFHSDSYLVSPELSTMWRVRVFVLYWREILLTGWDINELVFLIHMLCLSDLSHIRWDPIWAKHCGTRRLAGLSFFGIPNTVSLLNPTTNFAEWGVSFVLCIL